MPLLRALRDVEIAWPAVSVTLVDERWVDPQSSDSNEGLLRRELLDHIGTTIFLPLKNEATSAAEGVAITTATLAQIRWPLDVVVLGMGDDGHTASWFPGAPELDAAFTTTDMVVATQPPSAAHARITLSRRAVLNSRLLLLHITGADKRAVLDTALASHDSARLPVCAVLHQSDTPIDIYWSPE